MWRAGVLGGGGGDGKAGGPAATAAQQQQDTRVLFINHTKKEWMDLKGAHTLL